MPTARATYLAALHEDCREALALLQRHEHARHDRLVADCRQALAILQRHTKRVPPRVLEDERVTLARAASHCPLETGRVLIDDGDTVIVSWDDSPNVGREYVGDLVPLGRE